MWERIQAQQLPDQAPLGTHPRVAVHVQAAHLQAPAGPAARGRLGPRRHEQGERRQRQLALALALALAPRLALLGPARRPELHRDHPAPAHGRPRRRLLQLRLQLARALARALWPPLPQALLGQQLCLQPLLPVRRLLRHGQQPLPPLEQRVRPPHHLGHLGRRLLPRRRQHRPGHGRRRRPAELLLRHPQVRPRRPATRRPARPPAARQVHGLHQHTHPLGQHHGHPAAEQHPQHLPLRVQRHRHGRRPLCRRGGLPPLQLAQPRPRRRRRRRLLRPHGGVAAFRLVFLFCSGLYSDSSHVAIISAHVLSGRRGSEHR